MKREINSKHPNNKIEILSCKNSSNILAGTCLLFGAKNYLSRTHFGNSLGADIDAKTADGRNVAALAHSIGWEEIASYISTDAPSESPK